MVTKLIYYGLNNIHECDSVYHAREVKLVSSPIMLGCRVCSKMHQIVYIRMIPAIDT